MGAAARQQGRGSKLFHAAPRDRPKTLIKANAAAMELKALGATP
jgi:hypothetical protein